MSDSCKCQELQWRLDRSLSLHTQTTCQLANTEADLVEAKKEIRRLKSRIRELEGSIQIQEVSCS